MDIEYHYYITYIISTRAGFKPKDAFKIAYSSQYVDDNYIICNINKGKDNSYSNYISQTMNIFKPRDTLFRIYPLFHFIPGNPIAKSAGRKDGKMHWLNTTPNSKNANSILDSALESNNLYRIGIAIHAYVDTWAHQNFIGYNDDFNAIPSARGFVSPNVGHGNAGHKPDEPALIWEDARLINPIVNNKDRFIEASKCLYEKLAKYNDRTDIENGKSNIANDLDKAIGKTDKENKYVAERIDRYIKLSLEDRYGGVRLPKYDKSKWVNEAINKNVRGMPDHTTDILSLWDPVPDTYSWKNAKKRESTNWYKFQEAVIEHQSNAINILDTSNFKELCSEYGF